MPTYRIFRGENNPATGRPVGFGSNVTADNAREAVLKDEREDRAAGVKSPLPVFAVYELVPVPEAQWKP